MASKNQTLEHRVGMLEVMLDDKLETMSNNYVALQSVVLEALSKRSDLDSHFVNERMVAMEAQIRDMRAKLLELSPELG